MVRKIQDPVKRGLDSICGGNDAAIGRIFGVSRQSVGQWRKYSSIPRHFMRAFCELTGVTIVEMLEFDELTHGVNFDAFVKSIKKRAEVEADD